MTCNYSVPLNYAGLTPQVSEPFQYSVMTCDSLSASSFDNFGALLFLAMSLVLFLLVGQLVIDFFKS